MQYIIVTVMAGLVMMIFVEIRLMHERNRVTPTRLRDDDGERDEE